MALGSAYTGEAAIDAVADRIEPEVGIDDAEESVILALFAAVVEGLFQAQESGNATNRLGELLLDANGDRNAPIATAALRDLAINAKFIRAELLNTVAGLTVGELLATDGGNHDWNAATFGPTH